MTLEELYRVLRSSHVQTQGVVDTLPEPLLVLDKTLCVVNANPAFFSTFAVERDDVIGHNLFDLGNGQWDIRELRGLLADVVPKAAAIVGYEVSYDFPHIGQRTMEITARRLSHPDTNSSQMLVVFHDVTQQRKTDGDKDVLLAETRHRMKNLLAIVRAVATQTEIEGKSAAQYREVLLGRLDVVLNAQMFVSSSSGTAGLADLVDQVIRPAAGRAEIAPGPTVALGESQILSVSMVLHELVTNAFKYGALSRPEGTINVGWDASEQDGQTHLVINWQEQGGPTVTPPERRGFGTDLIKHSVAGEGGDACLDFAPDGLRAILTLPLENFEAP